jgi:predicted metal-dependent hydrolase
LQPVYDVRFKRVSVRDQKSRWGSCSRDGRLSFSYKIVFLPPGAARYIVAHELSHLKEFNHSRAFWAWVAASVPDYKEQRKEMKKWSLR